MSQWTEQQICDAARKVIEYAYRKNGDDAPNMKPYIEKDITGLLAGNRGVQGHVAIDLQCSLTAAVDLLRRSAPAWNHLVDYNNFAREAHDFLTQFERT